MRKTEEIVRRVLGFDAVVSVDISTDEDLYGEPLFRVRVVFDEDLGKLDVDAMLGLPEVLISEAPELEKSGFPVITYVDRHEVEQPYAAQ